MDNRDEISWESCVDEKLLDQRAALRREVAGLAHHGISCGNGRNDLAERYRERVVPRRNDGDDTERLESQIAAFGFRGNAVMWNPLSAKSAGGIPGPVFRRIESDENIRKESFDARLARFAHNGVRQFIARSHNAFAKPAQFCASIADRKLRPCALGDSRAGNDLRQ